MSAATDVSDTTAATLLDVMKQAAGAQPFLTFEAAAAMGAHIIAEVKRLLAGEEGDAASEPTPAPAAPRVLLTKKELARALKAGTTTIDNMRKLPSFPEHHLTGTTRGLRFDLEEVRQWQAEQRRIKEEMRK